MDLMWPEGSDFSKPVRFFCSTDVSNTEFFGRYRRYLTADKDILRYRQELFRNILSVKGLEDFLIALHGKLTEYAPLMKLPSYPHADDAKIHRMLYPTAYTALVRLTYDTLRPMMRDITAVSIKNLFAQAEADSNSPEFRRLEAYFRQNASSLREIRSVTVGVNLDALYRPKEAGIIALHREEYRSGDLLDRILRLDFARDDFHCIAPLTRIDSKLGFGESQQVNYAFLKAVGQVLDSGLSHCGKRLLRYTREHIAPYFSLLESLTFVIDAIRQLTGLRENDIPMCFPNISEDGSARILSLYDDTFARSLGRKKTVPNNICFAKDIHCYLLTGPNSGGKTVFLRAVASAQCYFQLGMPIPAKEADLPLFDGIFRMSTETQIAADTVGRFERECMVLAEILEQFEEKSLLLMDETFTSTAPEEALPLAAGFIARLCEKGGKCIFVTHLHALQETLPQLAAFRNQVDHLHAEVQGERRTYSIRSGRAEAHSGAREIAHKYGLLG